MHKEEKKASQEEVETKKSIEIDEEKVSKKEASKLEKLEQENEKLKAELSHYKNEYYRAYADMKNLRSKLEKDFQEAKKYSTEGFIEDILPVLDSFSAALSTEPTSPEVKNYLVGFQYLFKNFLNVLEAKGVTSITPKEGDKFDALSMNAVDTVVGEKENLVTKVYSNGYKLYDRLIRPASVQVSVLTKEEDKNETKNETKTDA